MSINICYYCGKEVPPAKEEVRIRTRRGTDICLCKKCYEGTLGRNRRKGDAEQ